MHLLAFGINKLPASSGAALYRVAQKTGPPYLIANILKNFMTELRGNW